MNAILQDTCENLMRTENPSNEKLHQVFGYLWYAISFYEVLYVVLVATDVRRFARLLGIALHTVLYIAPSVNTVFDS